MGLGLGLGLGLGSGSGLGLGLGLGDGDGADRQAFPRAECVEGVGRRREHEGVAR